MIFDKIINKDKKLKVKSQELGAVLALSPKLLA